MNLLWVILLLIPCCGRINSVILLPQASALRDLCPGDRVVMICNISGANLNWKWQQKMLSFTYNILRSNVENITVPLDLKLPDIVIFTLLDFHLTMPQYLTSSFEYRISDNFTKDTVCCNSKMIQLRKNCSLILENFNIRTGLQNSSFLLSWRTNLTRRLKYRVNENPVGLNEIYTSIPTDRHYIELFLECDTNYSVIIKLDSYHNDMLVAIVNITLQGCDNSSIFLRANILNNKTVTTMVFYPTDIMMDMTFKNSTKNLTNNYGTNTFSAYITQDTTSTGFQKITDDSTNTQSVTKVIPASSNINQILLLGGSLFSLIIICTVAIIIAVIVILLKKRKGKERRVDNHSQNEEEYDHFRFPLASKTVMEGDDLYSSLHAETNKGITTDEVEEYNTIHHPLCVQITSERDDYDYTSIRYNESNTITSKQNQKEEKKYAVLEYSAADTNQNDFHYTNQDKQKVQYAVLEASETSPDSLLTLDTLLIELRDIAPRWEELGRYLKIPASKLVEIKSMTNGVDFDCLIEICDKWIRQTNQPTWNCIAYILEQMGEKELSEELLNIYITGELPEKKYKATGRTSENVSMEDYDEPPPVPPQYF